jgi:PIN domain nuclease of toxin-antitoxin system
MAEADGGDVAISSISAWELAMIVGRGRLDLNMPAERWLSHAAAIPRLRFVSIDMKIAVAAANLPGELHGDPADRLIVATALQLDARLVTGDRKLRAYPHVRTIW